MSTDTDFFKHFDPIGVKKLTNQPSRILSFIKNHSVENTIPIAAINAWLQFSLAYAAAIIITSNDLSFITSIFNPTLMSAYALVSVTFGAILLTSLALKHMNRQEIEESSIDIKIRGGKPNEISEINKKAEKTEMIIKLGSNKKFSIIIPISKTQGVILKDQIEENRNKVILLAIPYVISATVIIGALLQDRFSFTNVLGWKEWSFISLVFIIAAVGAYITLNKLKNNEIDNEHNIVKKFDNLDILLPWRKCRIISVMKQQATTQEENGPLTPVIRVLREIGDKLCGIVRERAQGVENNFNDNINKFLKEIKGHIKTLLDNLEKDIKQNVGEVKITANKKITDCLQEIHESVDALCKEVGEQIKYKLNEIDVKKSMDLVSNLDKLANTVEDRVARFRPGSYTGLAGGAFAGERVPNLPTDNESGDNQTLQDGSEFIGTLVRCNKKGDALEKQLKEIKGKQGQPNYASNTNKRMQLKKEVRKFKRELGKVQKKDSLPNSHTEEITTLNRKIKEIEELLKKVQNKQNKPDSCYNSPGSEDGDNTTHPLKTRVKEQRKKVRQLKLQGESNELAEEQERLEKKLEELSKQKEWKEKLNGPASKLFDSLLKPIELEIVDPEGTKTKTTLRELGSKIKVHYGNGEQKICPIRGNRQIPPGAAISFLYPKIQEAWKMANGGKSR